MSERTYAMKRDLLVKAKQHSDYLRRVADQSRPATMDGLYRAADTIDELARWIENDGPAQERGEPPFRNR